MVSAAKKCQHRRALTQLDGDFGLHGIGDEAGFVRGAVNSFQGCRVCAAHAFGPQNEALDPELAAMRSWQADSVFGTLRPLQGLI